MKDIDTILKAINLAHLDAITSVEISISDLLTLRDEINSLRRDTILFSKRASHLECELLRVTLESRPLPKLSTYA